MVPLCSTARTSSLREQLVAEAQSWLGTPYHLNAMKKGVGCDCATLLLGVLQACSFAQDEISERHIADWFCHTREEKYLKRMMKHASLVAQQISYTTLVALPGDLVLTRHDRSSKVFNHGGIVTRWPKLIHAVHPVVEEVDASQHDLWCFREVCVFSLFEENR